MFCLLTTTNWRGGGFEGSVENEGVNTQVLQRNVSAKKNLNNGDCRYIQAGASEPPGR